jgi:hypothetical protein
LRFLVKDWTKQDNFSEMEKSKKRRRAEDAMESLFARTILNQHPRKPGAIVEKFKRIGPADEVEAMKNIKGDTFTRYANGN